MAVGIDELLKIIEIEKDEADFKWFELRALHQPIQVAVEVARVIESRDVVGDG